jgi:hypothetical protein
MTDNKTEQLSLRMSPRAKKMLRIAAVKEHRSASNMVEHLVLNYCEKNGISDDAQPSQEQQPAPKDLAQ